ncbi:stage II sporulation protein R [Tumebacillus sp. DT12]|uniref:Stage II sporulation protein R n=1 Tax=Tumebacillus lacus TaxID=2995335 RepID=A0ABT3WY16_9BACL|nr:stage II sporulation protein R [Tumebacillus lacus]MCX7569568.1 stage II sporulation protein R [Tumebacillus lacus]
MRKGWVAAAVLVSMVMGGYLAANGQAAPAMLVEQQKTKSELQAIAEEEGIIPNESIRLRIIANSDDAADQQLKRDIRDRIIQAVAEEVRGIEDEELAREQIRLAVPRMNEIAAEVIAEQGYSYDVSTDFGLVPFPTKLYGDTVYPAGDYEALRIQIGEAQGQNWWCVLFPPLCFVDMANGDAVQAKDMDEETSEPITTVSVTDSADGQEKEVEVRSALFDTISGWFGSLFA